MADEFMKRFARGNTYRRYAVRRVIVDSLARETDPDELWEALLWLGKTSRTVTDGSLQFAFSKIRNPQDGNVLQMRPSTADQRAAVAQALAAKFRAQEALEGQQALELEAAPTTTEDKPA